MKKTLLAILLIPLLAGCAGIQYAASNYSDVNPVNWSYGGKSWRIFDKPEENRMMITAGIGESVGMGLAEGLTLGLVDADFHRNKYRDAAVAWLENQGRDCEETDTVLIIKPQWEVKYECE